MSNEVPIDPLLKCKEDTLKHINRVRHFVWLAIDKLVERSNIHDASKLQSPELEGFAAASVKLSQCHYPSPEYTESLKELKPTLDHHYANNRHHPEHWPDGVNDMTLIDLIEMLADWKAATERQKDGNIRKSVEHNASKFNFTPQLRKIFENTVRELFEK